MQSVPHLTAVSTVEHLIAVIFISRLIMKFNLAIINRLIRLIALIELIDYSWLIQLILLILRNLTEFYLLLVKINLINSD